MDSYITWPYQIADHNCRITWVHNKTLYHKMSNFEPDQSLTTHTTLNDDIVHIISSCLTYESAEGYH